VDLVLILKVSQKVIFLEDLDLLLRGGLWGLRDAVPDSLITGGTLSWGHQGFQDRYFLGNGGSPRPQIARVFPLLAHIEA